MGDKDRDPDSASDKVQAADGETTRLRNSGCEITVCHS